MSSVASKLSNISSEGVLAIMMGNCITHTHTHVPERAFSYTYISILP